MACQKALDMGKTTRQVYSTIDGMEALEKVRQASGGLEYIALEKVDGANFAFETDGSSIEYFSRHREEPVEKHINLVGKTTPVEAMRQYHDFVFELFRVCAAHFGAENNVVVYGEYFGGWHPDLQGVKGPGAGFPVQHRVAYAPVHCFYAFDLLVGGEWPSFDTVTLLLTQSGFPLIAKPEVRGSFAECIAANPNNFQTSIPEQLGYPLCTKHCIIEGFIVRPVQGRVRGATKNWIKTKSWSFLEECPDELAKALRSLSEPEDFEKLYLHFCVRSRLYSVLSHEPRLRSASDSNLSRVQEMFRQDVEVDLSKRIATAGLAKPQNHLFAASRALADQYVAEWMIEEYALAQAEIVHADVACDDQRFPEGEELHASRSYPGDVAAVYTPLDPGIPPPPSRPPPPTVDEVSQNGMSNFVTRTDILRDTSAGGGERFDVSDKVQAFCSRPGDSAKGYLPLHPGHEVIIDYVGSAGDDVGWLYGRTIDEQGQGWFPSNVVSQSMVLQAVRSYTAPGDGYLTLQTGTKVTIDYIGVGAEELGWLFGHTHQQVIGWFPAEIVVQ